MKLYNRNLLDIKYSIYYNETMIDFDYLELMQLKLCMDMTKDKMFMGGDMRRHASITEKVETELRMLDGVSENSEDEESSFDRLMRWKKENQTGRGYPWTADEFGRPLSDESPT